MEEDEADNEELELKDRMKHLKEVHHARLISDEEYGKKRKEMIREF